MSTKGTSGTAVNAQARRAATADEWQRVLEGGFGPHNTHNLPGEYFHASLQPPGQDRAVAYARAYLLLAAQHARDNAGRATLAAAKLVMDRVQRGQLTRPPMRPLRAVGPQYSAYRLRRDLEYNARVTRAWLLGAAFSGDTGLPPYPTARVEQLANLARANGWPLPPRQDEAALSRARADLTDYERQLRALDAAEARVPGGRKGSARPGGARG